MKDPMQPIFVGQPCIKHESITRVSMNHMLVEYPLLAHRKSRDLAKLSTAARELTWYAIRVVNEMREVWYGSDGNTGARELGPKWISMLEAKQREQFGRTLFVPLIHHG